MTANQKLKNETNIISNIKPSIEGESLDSILADLEELDEERLTPYCQIEKAQTKSGDPNLKNVFKLPSPKRIDNWGKIQFEKPKEQLRMPSGSVTKLNIFQNDINIHKDPSIIDNIQSREIICFSSLQNNEGVNLDGTTALNQKKNDGTTALNQIKNDLTPNSSFSHMKEKIGFSSFEKDKNYSVPSIKSDLKPGFSSISKHSSIRSSYEKAKHSNCLDLNSQEIKDGNKLCFSSLQNDSFGDSSRQSKKQNNLSLYNSEKRISCISDQPSSKKYDYSSKSNKNSSGYDYSNSISPPLIPKKTPLIPGKNSTQKLIIPERLEQPHIQSFHEPKNHSYDIMVSQSEDSSTNKQNIKNSNLKLSSVKSDEPNVILSSAFISNTGDILSSIEKSGKTNSSHFLSNKNSQSKRFGNSSDNENIFASEPLKSEISMFVNNSHNNSHGNQSIYEHSITINRSAELRGAHLATITEVDQSRIHSSYVNCNDADKLVEEVNQEQIKENGSG